MKILNWIIRNNKKTIPKKYTPEQARHILTSDTHYQKSLKHYIWDHKYDYTNVYHFTFDLEDRFTSVDLDEKRIVFAISYNGESTVVIDETTIKEIERLLLQIDFPNLQTDPIILLHALEGTSKPKIEFFCRTRQEYSWAFYANSAIPSSIQALVSYVCTLCGFSFD